MIEIEGKGRRKGGREGENEVGREAGKYLFIKRDRD